MFPECPTDKQVEDACLNVRHDFGLLNAEDRMEMIITMRENWQAIWKVCKDSGHAAPTATNKFVLAEYRQKSMVEDLEKRRKSFPVKVTSNVANVLIMLMMGIYLGISTPFFILWAVFTVLVLSSMLVDAYFFRQRRREVSAAFRAALDAD